MKTRKPERSWSRHLRWPFKQLNTRTKLSLVMAISVFTLVLFAQLCNLIPDRNKTIMHAREQQTHTLALTGTAMSLNRNLQSEYAEVLEHAVKSDEQLLSAALRNLDGEMIAQTEGHDAHWKLPENGKSNDEFMFVPIFRGPKEIAQLELRFQSLTDVPALLTSPTVKLAAVMLFASFVIFNLILYRTLKQLDPRGAVPHHVREAFDHMAEGLIIMDRHGAIMMANSKFGRLVGIEPEDLTGQNCSQFPWLESEELPWEIAVRMQASVSNLTLQIVDQQEVLRTFSVSAAPVFSGSRSCRGVMVTFDDITSLEEHKLELIEARKAADAANEAKSNFLSRMSHEIRTPMNAIIGYADILRQGVQNPADQRQYLSTIHSSGEHLLTLINDILDLSKIEAGQMTLEKRPFSIANLLTQVISTLKLKTDQKNLELSLKIEGSIPAQVVNDETRLRQVLINIIGNAVKFTKRGGVMVVARMADGGQLLQFDIADSGVGIPENALEAIFKPFSQADDSVTRKFGGTGLGLAICRELSESMGGSIHVKSQEGVGTVFSFTINPGEINNQTKWISNQDCNAIDTVEQSQPLNTNRFEQRHILLVDDGDTNRKLAGLILNRLGLTYEEACNGKEAIEKVAAKDFDVVLMDISMPVMDGLTAAGLLRQHGVTTPLIALTALASPEERQRCLDGGFTDFLPKPVRSEKLVEILKQFIPLLPRSNEANTNGQMPSPTTPVQNSSTSSDDLVLPERLHSSLEMDDALRNIVIEYVQRLRSRIGEFDQAWQAGEISKLQELAHWLAGSASTVGFEEFVKPAKELEHSDGTNRPRIEQLIRFINELTDRIEVTEHATT